MKKSDIKKGVWYAVEIGVRRRPNPLTQNAQVVKAQVVNFSDTERTEDRYGRVTVRTGARVEVDRDAPENRANWFGDATPATALIDDNRRFIMPWSDWLIKLADHAKREAEEREEVKQSRARGERVDALMRSLGLIGYGFHDEVTIHSMERLEQILLKYAATFPGEVKPASACENCDCDDPTATPGLAEDCDCARHKNTDKEP